MRLTHSGWLSHSTVFPASSTSTRPRAELRHGQPLLSASRTSLLATLLMALSLELGGCNFLPGCKQCLIANEVPAPTPGKQVSVGSGVSAYAVNRGSIMFSPGASTGLSFYDSNEPTHELPVTLSTPVDAKPLLSAIPESVFFVYKSMPGPDGHPHRVPAATAFVVSVPDQDHKRFARFLVTARHVVDPEWAHCEEQNPKSITIKLNRWSGGVGFETIPLETAHLRQFFTPADSTVDLAIIPLDPTVTFHFNDYKFLDVPFRLLPTASQMGLMQIDQQVITAALLTKRFDAEDFPVSRSGVLSDMPSDPVNIQCGAAHGTKPVHMWFINAAVPRGLSGAPVYTALDRGKKPRTPVLLGIQSVVWPDRALAGITSAAALGDLIQSALSSNHAKMDFERAPDF